MRASVRDGMAATVGAWLVLVVDDDADVHDVTGMALRRFKLDDKPVQLLHAHSGAEGREMLLQHQDIAVVLLDVVMETEHSGLDLARWCRETLGNRRVRIVLRTGQPGQAPEEKVIVDYDINDYRDKTELDRKRLYTVMYTALRGYRDIMVIERERHRQQRYRQGLERVLEASTRLFVHRDPVEFASALLQQVAAVLHAGESAALVKIRGVSAIQGENEFEVLASVGEGHPPNAVDSDLLDALRQNTVLGNIFSEEKIFVGNYGARDGRSVSLALKGLGELDEVDAQLLEVFAGSVSVAFENILLSKELQDTQQELIYRLGDVVESRSSEAGSHVKRVAELSYLLAVASGLSQEEAQVLRSAAPMHDVGKIAIPDAVLLKAGKLTADEWAVMRRHPEVGFSILAGSRRPIIAAAAIVAHQHHEKFDGSGYPLGLKGEEIHIFGRIIAVVDVFDALTHARCYKEAWSVEATIEFMRSVRSTHLDGRIVDLLVEHLDEAVAINTRFPG